MTLYELVFALGTAVTVGSICAGAVTDNSRYDKLHYPFYYTAIFGVGTMVLTAAFGLHV